MGLMHAARAVAIVVIWWIALSVSTSRSSEGLIASSVAAAAISAVVVLAQRKHVMEIVCVGIGALLGIPFGLGCLSSLLGPNTDVHDFGFSTVMSTIVGVGVGAFAGACIGSLMTYARTQDAVERRDPNEPGSHSQARLQE